MKKMVLALMVAMVLALPMLALADGELTVIGTATVTLTPDMAELSVGVETHAETVNEAVSGNSDTLRAVIDALAAMSIDEGDISTNSYYVGMDYNYAMSPAALTGYYVSNTLNVVVRDIEQIGDVIDAATAAGANQVYGITFRSSQEADSHDRALTLAIEEGMRKAQLMAAAGGCTLGQLKDIAEDGMQSYGVSRAYDLAASSAGTTIMAGELSVTASVTLTFELR